MENSKIINKFYLDKEKDIIIKLYQTNEDELTYLAPHFDNARQTIRYIDPNKHKEISIETYSGDWEIVYKSIKKGQSFDLSFIAVDRRK